jgi:hypothetical protein
LAADEARQMAVKGKKAEGLARMSEGAATATSDRERFLWQLELARYCASSGYSELAEAQSLYLETAVAQYNLESWQPGLALEVAKLYLSCAKPAPNMPIEPEKSAILDKMRSRVARLDAKAALEFFAK